MPNTKVKNDGINYLYGYNIKMQDTTLPAQLKWTITPGEARDTTDSDDIVSNVELSLDGSIVGAGGVDLNPMTGTELYFVFVINDSTNKVSPNLVASLSDTAPIIPGEFDSFRKIGFVSVFGGNNKPYFQVGTDRVKKYYFDAQEPIIAAGTSNTFDKILVDGKVPSKDGEILAQIFMTAFDASTILAFKPLDGNVSTEGIYELSAGFTGGVVDTRFLPVTKSTQADETGFLYKFSDASSSLTMFLTGYVDYL